MSAKIASTAKAGAPDALASSAATPPNRDPPAGYSVINIDGRQYLVPRFRVPALQHVIAAERFYSELGVDQAAGGPRPTSNEPFVELEAAAVPIPALPLHSDREALYLHGQILSMQERLGLSYKDAAHRLYLAEVARLEVEQEAMNGIEGIQERVDNAIFNEIIPVINYIDQL